MAERIHGLVVFSLLPMLEAEHRLEMRLAYRDQRREEYSAARAEIEGLAARLALLKPRLMEPVSRATVNELRHIPNGLATLTHSHVEPRRDHLSPCPTDHN